MIARDRDLEEGFVLDNRRPAPLPHLVELKTRGGTWLGLELTMETNDMHARARSQRALRSNRKYPILDKKLMIYGPPLVIAG